MRASSYMFLENFNWFPAECLRKCGELSINLSVLTLFRELGNSRRKFLAVLVSVERLIKRGCILLCGLADITFPTVGILRYPS